MDGEAGAWIDRDGAEGRLPDARLTKRRRKLLAKLLDRRAGARGRSLPLACPDGADTTAAYRFFANDRVGDDHILAGHFASTRDRIAAAAGPILRSDPGRP